MQIQHTTAAARTAVGKAVVRIRLCRCLCRMYHILVPGVLAGSRYDVSFQRLRWGTVPDEPSTSLALERGKVLRCSFGSSYKMLGEDFCRVLRWGPGIGNISRWTCPATIVLRPRKKEKSTSPPPSSTHHLPLSNPSAAKDSKHWRRRYNTNFYALSRAPFADTVSGNQGGKRPRKHEPCL